MNQTGTPPCKHFDVCGLPGTFENEFCILHFPNQNKSVQEFNIAIRQHLQASSDFQHVYFSNNHPPNFQGVRFQRQADFRHAVIPQNLMLRSTHLPGGLLVTAKQIRHIDLLHATAEGPIEIKVNLLPNGIDARFATLQGDISIEITEGGNIDFTRCQLPTSIKLRGKFNGSCNFTETSIPGILDLQEAKFREITFSRVKFKEVSSIGV